MSSSDDDVPLTKASKSNGTMNGMYMILNDEFGFENWRLGVSSASRLTHLDMTTWPYLTSIHCYFHKMSLTDARSGNAHKSKDFIPESLDKAMDRENPPVKNGAPGISIRNGPVDEMEIDGPEVNGKGSSKRKSRGSMSNAKSYKEATDEEEDDDEKPLVRYLESGVECRIWRC